MYPLTTILSAHAGMLGLVLPDPLAALGLLVLVTLVTFLLLSVGISRARYEHLMEEAKSLEGSVSPDERLKMVLAERLFIKGKPSTEPVLLTFLEMDGEPNDTEELKNAIAGWVRTDDLLMPYQNKTALLMDVPPRDAHNVLHRVAAHASQKEMQVKLTAASFPFHGETPEQLIAAAEAQQPGGDDEQVVYASPEQSLDNESAAHQDALLHPETGLLKAEKLPRVLARYASSLRREKKSVALLRIEVDNLASYMDLYGEEVCAQVRNQLAKVVHEKTRVKDLAAHFERDGFLVCAGASESEICTLAERLGKLAHEVNVGERGQALKLSVSIGVATAPKHGRTLHDIITAAETACRYVLSQGGNSVLVYDPVQQGRPGVDTSMDAL